MLTGVDITSWGSDLTGNDKLGDLVIRILDEVPKLPRLRLSKKTVAQANSWIAPNLMGKGKGTRSMANWDEDSVTMSVEAIRRVLGKDDDRSHVDSLFFASTTMPFVDRLNSGIIRAALTLEEETALSLIHI